MFALAFLLPTQAFAATLTCSSAGYGVGFFNGVWNTPLSAGVGLARLRDITEPQTHGEPEKFELFYNDTGSRVGATALQDLAETFEQRSAEIDSSGDLARRFEILWDTMNGRQTVFERLLDLVPNLSGVLSSLYTTITSKIVAQLATVLSSPPTLQDYARHNQQLFIWEAVEHRKILLIAHSQGNLFVNHAYRDTLGLFGGTTASVQVVHVAPASPTVNGAYVLADIDLVINGLRAFGLSSVPPVNINLSTSSSDVSGHQLVETYLDASRSARYQVETLVQAAVPQLVPDFRLTFDGRSCS